MLDDMHRMDDPHDGFQQWYGRDVVAAADLAITVFDRVYQAGDNPRLKITRSWRP